MRSLAMWTAGHETALETFQADCLMAAGVAVHPEQALLRTWSRPQQALSGGRYHRIRCAAQALQRRLSGGRIVPLGPGVLGMTLATSSAWLAPGAVPLRPDQILNRALRPLLAVLRGLGADAFYPGRDLVTVGGRVVAYASFCPFPDGVLLVEQLIAVTSSFSQFETLLLRLDPEGIAAVDRTAFRSATTLAELVDVPAPDVLDAQLAAAAGERFGCEVRVHAEMPRELARATRASQLAHAAFQAERGPSTAGRVAASAISMLGVIEASAHVDRGGIHSLEITGDLIAPFLTIEELQNRCEGVRPAAQTLQGEIGAVLGQAGHFVLGAGDLAELLSRLA